MAVRLTRGGAYSTDIRALRGQVRANGTNPVLLAVRVTHPLTANAVDLYINLAYQPNGNLPPANASLYVVAFGNPNGVWHFAGLGGIGVAVPGVAFPGAINGSYASLGYALALPAITDANLLAAVQSVHAYAGAAVGAPVLDGMARLIIAISEALRFDVVESGVGGVLGNAGNYAPPVAQIHAWGGHTLGS
ncbi:ribosome-inactivating family protein [Collimonas sp. NPDC087041]|uniref:ribosome-inactivating family protein n=1 Tax=Collimonas sp. NPDC087041 TaxID=3363960 RepID=UPI0038058119